MAFEIHKLIIDKDSKELIDCRLMQTIADRSRAIYSMGYLVGKKVAENGNNPEKTIIKADIDDVLILSESDNVIYRYQMIEV